MDGLRLIMMIVFGIAAACIPLLLGMSTLRILYGKKYKQSCTKGESYIAGLCVAIGIAEVTFLFTILTGRSIRFMAFGMLGLTAAAIVVLAVIAGFFIVRSVRKEKKFSGASKILVPEILIPEILIPGAVFTVSVLLQIIFLMTGDVTYRQGDMTLEMVQSFLAAETPYEVNPLTGQAYTAGIPMRLKILCLPGLYASICITLGLDAGLVVCRLIPVVVLLASYIAYAGLGRTLFGDNKKVLLIFLAVVSALYWFGDYFASTDSFLILHGGFRGVSVRNAVLLPFVWNMCLSKKYRSILLAVFAEACIVWTLYGMGACLLSAAVMIGLRFVLNLRTKRVGHDEKKNTAANDRMRG